MHQIYNILSNVKNLLLHENITKQIKDIDEEKLDKFYIDINNLYQELKISKKPF